MSSAAQSKMALWLSGIYLVFGVGSWVLPLIAKPGEDMAAVFLLVFAQPWAGFWFWFVGKYQVDNFMLTMAVMLAGILTNAWVIHWFVSRISRR